MPKKNIYYFVTKKFIAFFLMVSILFGGLFYEFLSCIASIVLCIHLFLLFRKNKRLIFRLNLCSIAILGVSASYLLSVCWAVDSGMAFIGFVKYLPLPLFLLALMQEDRPVLDYLEMLPPAMAFMTVASAALLLFPALRRLIAPAGRLAGFIQYSNTFALFLLIALVVLCLKGKFGLWDFLLTPVFLLGILLSGSRTTFILTAISIVVLLFFVKEKKLRLYLIAIAMSAVMVAVIYVVISGDFYTIGRFLVISAGSSSLVGRLLYYRDALSIVFCRPFGTGHLGFYYLQQSIQTGLYAVRYVHNDFLQLLVDIGWVPTVLFVGAAFQAFFRKGADAKKRFLLFLISSHCFMEFNFQFIAVFMIFILLLDFRRGREYVIKYSNPIIVASLGMAAILSFYMAIPLSAYILGNIPLSGAMYPWNTDLNVSLLAAETDIEAVNARADRIIAQNQYVTVAYSAKANYYYFNGDFENMIRYKDKAIENAPLVTEEYEDYIFKLLVGEGLYRQAGDEYSAEYCRSKLNELLERFYHMKDRLSYFGEKIFDQPRFELSEETKGYLENPESVFWDN